MRGRTKWLHRLADRRSSPFLAISYVLVGTAGVLVFAASPAQALLARGGYGVTYAWGAFCLVAAGSGLMGMISRQRWLEVLGTVLGATASLTWCTAIVLHAVHTHDAAPLTAACMAATLSAKFAHRSVEIWSQEPQ